MTCRAHWMWRWPAPLQTQPPLRPHCRWCCAFAMCPAMNDDAVFVMAALRRKPEELTEADLVRLLRLIRGLGDAKSTYEELLTVRLKLGRAAPDGSGLKPRKTFRAWNDPVQAIAYLQPRYGSKAVKPVSPAQAEKLGAEGKVYATVGMGVHKPPGDMQAFY